MEKLAPGTRIGDYEILAELGGGGMGRVYRARDATLERIVALKTLAPQFQDDPVLVQRFLKEARAAARLNHPNIVQIYDFGKEGNLYYLAMEYVEGQPLSALLKNGPLPEGDAISIARFACIALSVAHAEGLVHRDIKPDNLMLTSKGHVKLVDLGVAKRVDEDVALTQTGQALGTPHYISPEQIRAEKNVDGRADLYSLGATLYHLVTGRPPFRGGTGALVMAMHLHQSPEDPRATRPELSAGIAQVIRKMMAKDPADRYPDAEAADRDLYRVEVGEEPEAAAFVEDPEKTQASAPVPRTNPYATPPGQGPPPAQSTTGVSTSPHLRALETELARHVGPLARVLVKRAARTAGSMRELIGELEKEIPGDKSRKAFRSAVEKLR